MDYQNILATLSDGELQPEVERLVAADCESGARVIAALIEVETRRLYLALGFSCLFTYCRDKLTFSEDVAFNRIEVARVARRFPAILDQLADGSLSLAAARLLAPHLTADNHKSLLRDAANKTKRDVERMVVKYRPLPPVPATVRKTPAPRKAASESLPPNASVGPGSSKPLLRGPPPGRHCNSLARWSSRCRKPPTSCKSPSGWLRTTSCAVPKRYCVIRFRLAIWQNCSIERLMLC